MKVNLIEFVAEENENIKILGKALVNVGDKIKMWFTIINSKDGKPFAVPASVYVDGNYKPAFQLADQVKMRLLCNSVVNEVVKNKDQ